jgi:hypothetical protein
MRQGVGSAQLDVFFNLAYNNLSLTLNFYHVIKVFEGVKIVADLQIRGKKQRQDSMVGITSKQFRL